MSVGLIKLLDAYITLSNSPLTFLVQFSEVTMALFFITSAILGIGCDIYDAIEKVDGKEESPS
jgi:hypothetical protein